MDLSRSLVKEFADIANNKNVKEKPSIYVRGTVKMVGDKKFVQLDGSDALTPLTETVDVQDKDRVLVAIENHTATVLGNFTFPPSARKEQEAVDKAEDAQNSANDAVNKAEDAQNSATDAGNKAQQAGDKADQAIEQAGKVEGLANDAKENAQQAIDAANKAEQNAADAKEFATNANLNAQTARGEAEKAQQAAANAQGEVAKINKEVDTVKGDIAGALTELGNQAAEIQATKETMELQYSKKTEVSEVEANLKTEISKKVGELQTTVEENYAAKTEIVDMEGKLQTQITQNAQGLTSQAQKVEKLESDTTEAKKQVDIALEKADNAALAAGKAQTEATNAQAAADLAKQNAETAATKAEESKIAADKATAAANAADEKLQSAQADLNEAKQNLTNVTNRVGATEAEIAEAQKKVDAAQTSVNKALADAAEANLAATNAKNAADKAQTDATNAQADATNAQKKADNAQLAASNAQAAADKAQQDVAALTSRVTEAETKIEQNAEAITLSASKIEEIGKRKSVTETTVYWYLSQSATELIGGEWIEGAAPAWKDGSYYWQKVLTKYFDGSTKESTPICLTGPAGRPGQDGVDGQNGTDGKGIKATEITYQASTSGTSVPTGNWTTTIPTVAAGSYLWTRTVVTYTDDSTSTSYSVGKMGSTGPTGGTGPQGKPGADGKGVKSTAIAYQASASGTIIPNGEWGETIPVVAPGSYLWTRTVITYTDNTSSASYSVGKMGDTGAAGKGVKNITNYYLATSSGSGVTESTSGWTTTIQTISDSKKYLWNYELITYTDGTSSKTTPCIIGAYGDKGQTGDAGATGVGISGITEYYQVSTSNMSAPTSWLTTVPTLTATNKYLWNYEKITYTNGTTKESAKRVIGVYGDKGATGSAGATGQGVESITVEYYLSTSKTTQTGGSWTITMPTWKTDTYLWIRNKIVYKNPTSTAYTTPYCDSSWEAAKDVADDLKNNYYNKTQTDAKFKIEADKISSTVSKVEVIEKTAIKSTVEEFYSSTSPTTLTGGSWSTTQPTWTPGKYIWRRTLVTKGDGTTSYTPSQNGVCITGNTGPSGPQGLQGPTGENGSDLSNGTMLFTDPTFAIGVNNTTKYANTGGEYLKYERLAKSIDNPFDNTEYEMVITNTGQVNPNIGGFKFSNQTRPNAVFIYRVIAKIPEGRNIVWAANSGGDGAKAQWLTPTNGTGKFEEYLLKFICGSTGTFPTIGYFYVDGSSGTTDNPVKWYVAYATCFDMTSSSDSLYAKDTADEGKQTADEALSKATDNESKVTISMTKIEQLDDQISALVTDENGNSLMIQDSSGWHFNIGAIQNTLNNTVKDLSGLTGDMEDAQTLLDTTKGMADALEKKTAFIDLTTVNGQPAILLGQTNSKFKLRITNTSIDFLEGTEAVAYISNQNLYITRAIIKNEIQIGDGTGWVLKRRPNGNLGLRWMN